MKFSIIDEDTFSVFIYDNTNFNKEKLDIDISCYLKELLIKLKKKYNYTINGYYSSDVYYVEKIGIYFLFKRIDDYYYSNQVIDIKIINHDNPIYLRFSDYDIISNLKKIKYFEGSFYINIDDISSKDVDRLVEFYDIVFETDFLNNVKYLRF